MVLSHESMPCTLLHIITVGARQDLRDGTPHYRLRTRREHVKRPLRAPGPSGHATTAWPQHGTLPPRLACLAICKGEAAYKAGQPTTAATPLPHHRSARRRSAHMHVPHTPARTAAAALAHARHGWGGEDGRERGGGAVRSGAAQAPMILSSRDAQRPSGPPVCGSGGGSGGAPKPSRASAPAARARCVACASVLVYVQCTRGV
jgi:hypothetical protein